MVGPKKIILITGADGFVGKNLVQHLKDSEQYAVIAHTKKSTESLGVETLVGNLHDISILDDVLSRVDIVIHLAAMVSYLPSDKNRLYRNNVTVTRDLVNSCLHHGVQKIIYVSSASTLTRSLNPFLVTEKATGRLELHSNYAKTKYLGELEIQRAMAEGMITHILNPCLMLGKGDWSKGSLSILKKISEGLTFYPEGNLGLVDVNLVVKAITACLKVDHSTGPHLLWQMSISYKEFIYKVCQILGVRKPFKAAGPLLSSWYAKWQSLKNFFTKKPIIITQETAFLSSQTFQYIVHNPVLNLPYEALDLERLIQISVSNKN